MKARFLRAGFAAALAFFLVLPAGALPQGQAPKPLKKQRIRIPFTPVHEDGTPARPVMLSIRVEAEDEAQAVEALNQVMDQLVVQPKIDDLADEIDQYLKNKLHSTVAPGGPPEESDETPDPTIRQVQNSADPQPRPTPSAAYLDCTAGANGACEVEETVEGLLEALDQVGNYLGLPSLLCALEGPRSHHVEKKRQSTDE